MDTGRIHARLVIASILLGLSLILLFPLANRERIEGQEERVVEIGELNESGVSGDATLIDNGDGTLNVDVLLTGESASHPMHIHEGTCVSPGDIVIPLAETDSNGGSVTTIAYLFSDLSEMGPLAIVVHRSENDMASFIACGNVDEALLEGESTTTGDIHTDEELLYSASSEADFTEWQADSWIHDGDTIGTEANANGGAETYVLAPFDLNGLNDFALEAEIRISGQFFPVDDCPAYFGFIFALVEPAEGIFAGMDNIGDGGAACPTRYAVWTPWIAWNATLEEIATLDGVLPPDNDWHTYRLEVEGDQITLLIDGVEVFTSTDERYSVPGSVGIVSGNLALTVRSFSLFRTSPTNGPESPATPESPVAEGSPEPTIAAFTGTPVFPANDGREWQTYENPAIGLLLRLPPDWQIVEEESGLAFRLYPPNLDPELPVPFISIAFDPAAAFDETDEALSGISPIESVSISGVTGRKYEDSAWAVPYQNYYIDLPYRGGTLHITAVKGPTLNLVPTLLEILLTLELSS